MKKLPIGIQNIQEILTEGYVYVDKTQFAYQLITTGKPYFLSRPRRFGKSLFLNTLSEIFKGNKELFKDCAIYQTDYDWKPYPVIFLDFCQTNSRETADFDASIIRLLEGIAQAHQVNIHTYTAPEALKSLIVELHQKYQQPVVVLIDEYDNPIINNLQDLQNANYIRESVKKFFEMLKSHDRYVHFTLVTGISKFSKVSLFSGANHLKDLTMHKAYADALGYTEAEILDAFGERIEAVIQARNITQQEVLAEIKQWYNGYRFTRAEACVYNPFSTLNYLDEQEPKSYWYSTGTPSFLIEQIQKYPKNLLPLGGIEVSDNRLSGGSKIDYIDVATLMFQTGYLTITDYSELERAYRLDFPNREVREAFLDSLLNELTDIDSLSVVRSAAQLRAAFEALDIAGLIKTLNIHFAKIAYHAHREQTQRLSEGFYQAVFFTFLERSGIETKVEEATSRGRIDMVVQLSKHVFIFELKVDQTAEIALDQVHDQGYKERYLEAGREIVVVGINFSTQSRDINEWKAGIYAPEGTLIREL